MPRRVRLTDFGGDANKGLWVTGPRERTPTSHMRRLTAINNIKERELRTRNGTVQDTTVANAHSLHRFDDVRFQGAGTSLFRAGVSIDTGYDGTPLEFVVAEPRNTTAAEFLFVSGGGQLRKVDTAGTVTDWGIAPPTGGTWDQSGGTGETDTDVTVTAPQSTVIADTNAVSQPNGSWSRQPFNSALLTVDSSAPTPTGFGICGEPSADDEIEESEPI